MKKALFIALLISASLTAIAQVTLTFNPAKGSEYTYRMEMIQKINQEVMGQKMDMNQNMGIDYVMNIIESSASNVKAEFQYNAITYSLTSAMFSMSYDSKNPVANPNQMDAMMSKILGSMLNKKFQVVIARDGSVTSVTGMQAIIDDMLKSVGANDAMGAQIGAQLSQQFSDEAMRASFEQSFKIYPPSSVKVGDTWSVNQDIDAAGVSVNTATTYTLRSIAGNKVTADIKSAINGMNGQLTGGQGGTVEFDAPSGLPVSSKVTQNIKGVISANGMEVPMDITSTINVTVNKTK